MTMRSFFGLVGLALLALLSWHLYEQAGEYRPRPAGPETHEPDLIIENFHMTWIGTSGAPRYFLRAKRMAHFGDDDSARLHNPVLEVRREGGAPWLVESEIGDLSSGADDVWLRGQVVITRPAAPGVRPVEIVTSEVYVRPDQEFAHTLQPAVMRSLGSTLSGIGLRAHFDTGWVEVLSNVRGEYRRAG